jgi:hypothetical protein
VIAPRCSGSGRVQQPADPVPREQFCGLGGFAHSGPRMDPSEAAAQPLLSSTAGRRLRYSPGEGA